MWNDDLEKRAAAMKARNLAGKTPKHRHRQTGEVSNAEPVTTPDPLPNVEPKPTHKIYPDVPIRIIPELRWHRLSMGELEHYNVLVFPAPDGEGILYEGRYNSRSFG